MIQIPSRQQKTNLVQLIKKFSTSQEAVRERKRLKSGDKSKEKKLTKSAKTQKALPKWRGRRKPKKEREKGKSGDCENKKAIYN